MKLKGTTTIELTNVKTGKKETIRHENFITEFASEYFKECGALNTNPLGSLQDTRPIDDLFGGIMLFDKKIDQNTDEAGNHPHPLYCPAGTKMVANGSIDFTQNSNATELGQYDATESGTPNDHQRVYVYNWDTDEGNGKINSVCLTTKAGGYIGAGNATSGVRDNTQSSTPRRIFKYAGATLATRTITGTDQNKLAGLSLSTSRVALLADTPKNCFNAGSVTVNWYDVPVSKLNPFVSKLAFDSSQLTAHPDAAKAITTRSNVAYAKVMGGTGYILLVGSANASIGAGTTLYASQLNKDGTVTEKSYNVQSATGISLSTEPSNYGYIGGKIIGNDLYLAYETTSGANATKRVRIKADGSVIDLTVSGNIERTFFVQEGRVMLGTNAYYDTQTEETYLSNAQVWNSYTSQVNRWGLWNCYDCNLAFCITGASTAGGDPSISPLTVLRPPCNWLSTINNLTNEIEKTSDKTMKVTYTLTLT